MLAKSFRAETRVAKGFFGAILGRINRVVPKPTRQLALNPITDDPLMHDIVAKTR
jgi:hypothetical protein